MKIDEYSKKHIHFYDVDIPKKIKLLLDNDFVRTVADIGCGDGAVLKSILDYDTNKASRMIYKSFGVDVSYDRIVQAMKVCGDRTKFILSDASRTIPIHNESIDLVVCNQVIEHVYNEYRLIKEMKRILRTGGVLYLTTVYKKKYAWYFYRNDIGWVLDPTHVREYGSDNLLIKALETAGFSVVSNEKIIHRFPITDFIFKRLSGDRFVYKKSWAKALRKVSIVIPGYYNWEIVCIKRGDKNVNDIGNRSTL